MIFAGISGSAVADTAGVSGMCIYVACDLMDVKVGDVSPPDSLPAGNLRLHCADDRLPSAYYSSHCPDACLSLKTIATPQRVW